METFGMVYKEKFKAGGDVILFPLHEYIDQIKSAIVWVKFRLKELKSL